MRAPGRAIARNTLLNLGGQALPLLIGLVALPFIVHGLGPERLGLLGLGWVALSYFSVLDLGMGRAAKRFAAEAMGRGARDEVPGIIWSAVAVQMVLGLVGAAVLAASAPFLATQVLRVSPDLVPDALSTFRVFAVAVPIVLVSASLRGGLEALQRFDLVNAVSAPGAALNFLLPLVGVLTGRGLPAILWMLVLARVATMIAFLVLCTRFFPGLLRGGPNRKAVKNLTSFGLWATVSYVVSPILDQLDRFLLGALAGVASVGYYTVPQELVFRFRILPTALSDALFPEFSGAGGDASRVPRFYALAVRLLAVILAPMVIVLVFLARDILGLWLGADFARQSAVALQWLAFGTLCNCVTFIPMSYLHGINRPDVPAKFHLIELPAFLLLAWFLMPAWGAAGAGAGWAVRAAADMILMLGAASRCGATRDEKLLTPAMYGWGTLVLASLALGFLSSQATLSIVTRGLLAVGAATIVFTVAWYGLLHGDDRGRLTGTFGRRAIGESTL